MKLFFHLLLGTALLLASGCAIVPVERYVHEATERIPSYRWTKQRVLPWKLRPAEGEVLLVPDFTTFSTSYPYQQTGFLHVFTRGNRSVIVIGADLEVAGTGVKQSVELNVATTPIPLPRDAGYWGARLLLFSDAKYGGIKNVDFTKISGADHLILTIRWRDGDRIVEQRFPLRRVIRKQDVWIT
jgi:hypothetical protein